MKKPRKKAVTPVRISQAYDLELIREIDAQLQLAREIADLALVLSANLMRLDRALRLYETDSVICFPSLPVN